MNTRQGDRRFVREPLAECGGQIRDCREVEPPLGVERTINLRSAIDRLAHRFHELP
jgi:hypothetical protein